MLREIRLTLMFSCASTLLACSPGPTEVKTSSGPDYLDQLSTEERTAYVADQQYIHSLAKPGQRVRLNLNDPRQYNFARTRLRLAQKNRENAPHLFELLDARRADHEAAGFKSGSFARPLHAGANETNTADWTEQHFIEGTSIWRPTPVTRQVVSAASSAYPNGSYAAGVDIAITTITGTPIGPFEYVEEYDSADITLSTTGNPALSNIKRYTISSYKWEDSAQEGFTDSYVYTEMGHVNALASSDPATLGVPVVTAPIDIHVDNKISICIDRMWTNDCDYVLGGGGLQQAVRMPLAGSIGITSTHRFDADAIQDIKDALNNNTDPGVDVGSLKLVLRRTGGGCDVTDSNTLLAKMGVFWNRVSLSADQRTLYWDLTNNNSAFFDSGCTQLQDDVKLTARIPFPLIDTNGDPDFTTSMTLSNDGAVGRPDYQFLRMEMTNSCLAEGTLVRLGDGRLVPVETLKIGQEIYNAYDATDRALTITDTAVGAERTPMVRLRDEAGRSLLVTEMHPVSTPDRGMIQARSLRAGDLVLTASGPSKLVEAGREPYNGKVYNVKLGTATELARLGVDQTTVDANGFIVGDGQIQSKYERLHMERHDGATRVDQVASQWRRDFELSPARK